MAEDAKLKREQGQEISFIEWSSLSILCGRRIFKSKLLDSHDRSLGSIKVSENTAVDFHRSSPAQAYGVVFW